MSLPLDRLPLEIQCKLFTYLKCKDLQALRLVSKGCNIIVRNTKMCKFHSCLLSDETYKEVIGSLESPLGIRVQNLTKKVGISSTRGGNLAGVESLSLGGSIHPYNVNKILEFCYNIECLGFNSFDKISSIGFFLSRRSFEFVTTFSIALVGITSNDELLLKKLSQCKRFQALEVFSVDWKPGHPVTQIMDKKLVKLLFSMYASIHKIFLNHRDTMKKIHWVFRGFKIDFSRVNVIPCTSIQYFQYQNLKTLLKEMVTLEEILIKKFIFEGQVNGFDLTQTLLDSQKNLKSLTLTHRMQLHNPVDETLFTPIIVPIEGNKLSLQDISIKTDVFPFQILEGCKAVKRLAIWTKLLILMNPVVLKGLTHLLINIQIKSVHAELDVDRMNWIYEDLLDLEELVMIYGSLNAIPSSLTFRQFLNMPKIEKVALKFFFTSLSYRRIITQEFESLVGLCQRTIGVFVQCKIKIEGSCQNVGVYELVCIVNRKKFTGFRE